MKTESKSRRNPQAGGWGRRGACAVGTMGLVSWLSVGIAQTSPAAGGGQPAPPREEAPRNPPTAKAVLDPNTPFVFNGGSLNDFIKRVNEHFGVAVFNRATIEVSYDMAVPKMRIQARARNEYGPLGNLFESYNALAINGFPHLGKWFWHGGVSDGLPDILTLSALRSPDGKASGRSKARAFSVKGLSPDQQKQLQNTILEFAERAAMYSMPRGGPDGEFSGRVSVNQDTQLMLAFGSESFLGLVESVVVEYRTQQLIPSAPPLKPERPEGQRP